MISVDVLRAKVAAGQITVDEMLEIIESQNNEIQELKTTKIKSPTELGEDLEGLYNYVDKNVNEEFNVNVIFDFFAFLIDKVTDQTGYKPNTNFIKGNWEYLPLEECFKALSAFRRKGASAFPTRQECERNTKVTLPTGEKGLMGEYMVMRLLEQVEKLAQETIEDVKTELTQGLTSGELSPEEYLSKQLAVEKIVEGELPKPKKAQKVEKIIEETEEL